MLRTIIIDDEKHCRENLKCLITNYYPDFEIIAEASSVKEAGIILKKERPELIFTDIRIPGEDIFGLLDRVTSGEDYFPGIIFTTGHDEYAITAFRYAAVGYLLKPINKQEFIEAVDRYIKLYSNKKWVDENSNEFKTFNQDKKINKLCLPVKKGLLFTSVNDIIYFKAEGNYTTVFFTNRKSILISKPILTFEKILKDSTFVRVHRTYLVNTEHISNFNTTENYLVLTNNITIEVSVRKHAYLLKALSSYYHI